MRPGFWNIPTPVERCVVTPDVVLAPLVGFDAAHTTGWATAGVISTAHPRRRAAAVADRDWRRLRLRGARHHPSAATRHPDGRRADRASGDAAVRLEDACGLISASCSRTPRASSRGGCGTSDATLARYGSTVGVGIKRPRPAVGSTCARRTGHAQGTQSSRHHPHGRHYRVGRCRRRIPGPYWRGPGQGSPGLCRYGGAGDRRRLVGGWRCDQPRRLRACCKSTSSRTTLRTLFVLFAQAWSSWSTTAAQEVARGLIGHIHQSRKKPLRSMSWRRRPSRMARRR